MADVNLTIKKWNGSAWEDAHPETTVGQIVTSGTPSSSTFLRGDGTWATPSSTAVSAEKVNLQVRFGEAVSKGDPVYISGYHGSNGPVIMSKAKANDSAKMPAFGLADDDYAENATGYAISIGVLEDIDTDSYTVGDTLYVAPTGGLTDTKPTGSNLIQNVGTVSRSNSNNGSIEVTATGRSNDVPNLTTGKLWVGSANNTIESATLHLDETNNRLGIGTTSPTEKLTVYGDSNTSENSPVTFIKHNFTGTHGFGLSISRDNSDIAALALGSNSSLQGVVVANNQNLILGTITSGVVNDAINIQTGGNVGIGTSSPDELLHIANTSGGASILIETASGSSGNLLFGDADSNSAGRVRYDHAANDLALWTNGAERVTVASDGNVGIGTTSPNAKLSIQGSTGVLELDNSATNEMRVLSFDRTTSTEKLLEIRASNTRFTTNANERMRITAGGNVGIGTTSPGEKLEVNGKIKVNNEVIATKFVDYNNGNYYIDPANQSIVNYIQAGLSSALYKTQLQSNALQFDRDGTSYINQVGTGNLAFRFGSGYTTRMTLTNDGNVGIGTTSPSQKLDVNGSIHGNSILADGNIYLNYDNSPTGADSYIYFGDDASDTAHYLTFDNSAQFFKFSDDIYALGNVYADSHLYAKGELRLNYDNSGDAIIRFGDAASDTAHSLSFSNSTQKFTLTDDLIVTGDVTVNGSFTMVDTNTSTTEQWTVTNDGTGPAVIINQKGSQPVIDIQDDGTSVFHIEDGGNVGIATTNPEYKLDVVGSGRFQGTGDVALILNADTDNATETDNNRLVFRQDGAVDILTIGTEGNAGQTYTGTAANSAYIIASSEHSDTIALHLGTNNVVRQTILNNGNVGIGTTSPSVKLDVNGAIQANRVVSENVTTTPDEIGNIKIARLHGTTTAISNIDNLDTFILSKTDGGYGSGTKPSGAHNGFGVISLQTHDGNYYTQLGLDTNQNGLWIRSADNATSYGSWQRAFADDYHPNADKWTTARTITLGGDLSGSVSLDGSANVTLTAAVADDSHNHTIANVDGLQTALNGKSSTGHGHTAGDIVTGELNTARMGSGTATSGYVLKSDGDGTASWQQDNNTTYTLGSFGVTATAAELNKMDGVTATTTELNYTDGVTSNIQTQLNGKAASSHSHGNLTSTGGLGATTTAPASGDRLVIADTSQSNKLVQSNISFGTSTSTFLRNDGSWAEPGGGSGGYEPEWEYVTKVTGSSQLTYSSMTPATYEYKFVVELQTTAEDTSNPYIRINNESTQEYSYQYSSVTQTAETTETVLNAGDALTSLIYTGADLSSYSSGGTSASTIHRAEFIYSVSPYTTSPGAYTATIRGWAHTHYVSQSGTSYDGMVQSTFVGTRDNLFFTEHERLDYIHSINAGGTDYHEMRVYRRPRK